MFSLTANTQAHLYYGFGGRLFYYRRFCVRRRSRFVAVIGVVKVFRKLIQPHAKMCIDRHGEYFEKQ